MALRMRKKIGLGMSIIDVITTMSEGNMGALNALMSLAKDELGMIYILDLDDMGMRGAQIWIAFKDACGQDLEKFKTFCRERDQKIVDIVNQNSGPDYPRAATHGKS